MSTTTSVPILNKEQLRRALFGLVESLDEIFAEFAYSQKLPFHPHRGSITKRPENFIFLSGGGTTIETWGDKNMNISLGARLKPSVQRKVEDHCCERGIGGLEIHQWRFANVALIGATDHFYIANPWIAFIPLEKLPAININNTPLR